MNWSAQITAFGWVDGNGFGGSLLHGGSGPLPDAPLGRWPWNHFSPNPCERFGRMDPLSKVTMLAVEMLSLSERAISDRDNLGLVLGTIHGCLEADLSFRRSMDSPAGPSPLHFMYTLPSSGLGEVSIRHALKGPSLCLMNSPENTSLALWEGIRLMVAEGLDGCICVEADAVDNDSIKLMPTFGRELESLPHGWAVLLERSPRGAGLARLARAETDMDCAREVTSALATLCRMMTAQSRQTALLTPPATLPGAPHLVATLA